MTMETKKRKTSAPPTGYVCKICGVEGHWIQQCPQKSKSSKKQKTHVPVPGVDPSQKDIDLAREYQKIKPPNCFCGQPSRLKKVKRSNVNANSRAVGKYFFFCASKKSENPCRFARPVNEHRQRKHEHPSKEEEPETDTKENEEVGESDTASSEQKHSESLDLDGDKAETECRSKKKSVESRSPPKVAVDGSESNENTGDSSNDDSSGSSGDSSDSSDSSSDED